MSIANAVFVLARARVPQQGFLHNSCVPDASVAFSRVRSFFLKFQKLLLNILEQINVFLSIRIIFNCKFCKMINKRDFIHKDTRLYFDNSFFECLISTSSSMIALENLNIL